MFETNAYLTPKRESANEPEPYLKQNLMNLRQTLDEDSIENDSSLGPELVRSYASNDGEEVDPAASIINTSDISNYFNLQITTKLFFGSN